MHYTVHGVCSSYIARRYVEQYKILLISTFAQQSSCALLIVTGCIVVERSNPELGKVGFRSINAVARIVYCAEVRYSCGELANLSEKYLAFPGNPCS